MIVSWIAKVFVAINSNKRTSEIAWAISVAFILALIPKGNLLWIALFVLTFFLKLNQAVEMVFIVIFNYSFKFLDRILDRIGYIILTIPNLEDFFTKLFNNPFFYLSKYYNSLVMGGLIVGLIMAFPIYFLSKFLVEVYRDKIRDKMASNKFVKAFMKQPLIVGIKRSLGSAVRFYENVR
ncbi:MAG: TIGR03546 family protein [candidate division WOR-3 bacterium]|jgi:uncharacterized protein (TIGR03546 family)